MARATKFYKQICALAMAAVMVAGMPMSVRATGNDANEPDSASEETLHDQDGAEDDEESDADPSDEEESNASDESGENNNSGSDSGADVSGNGEEADPLGEDHPSGIYMIDPDPDDNVSAEGSATGNGSVRITTIKRPKNVVSMVVPILGNISYDFVLDPEGLLALNPENTIIGGDSSFYFRSNESANTYSVFAEVATAVNKSTVPVMVSLDLDVSGAEDVGITMTDLNGVHSATTPSLCLAILPTEIGTVGVNEEVGELPILKSEMAATDSQGHAFKEILIPGTVDNFELVTLTTNERDVYVQEYQPLEDASWSAAGFTLYGVCSRDTDWTDVVENLKNDKTLSLTITYRMTPVFETEGEDD